MHDKGCETRGEYARTRAPSEVYPYVHALRTTELSLIEIQSRFTLNTSPGQRGSMSGYSVTMACISATMVGLSSESSNSTSDCVCMYVCTRDSTSVSIRMTAYVWTSLYACVGMHV